VTDNQISYWLQYIGLTFYHHNVIVITAIVRQDTWYHPKLVLDIATIARLSIPLNYTETSKPPVIAYQLCNWFLNFFSGSKLYFYWISNMCKHYKLLNLKIYNLLYKHATLATTTDMMSIFIIIISDQLCLSVC